jgi:hypothetical protein
MAGAAEIGVRAAEATNIQVLQFMRYVFFLV